MMTLSARMWSLAATFPTLFRWADKSYRDGADFDGNVVIAALAEPWVTTGSRYALLFVLDVWNSDAREYLPGSLREWSFVSAWACWDDAHRAAALAWLKAPWFP